MQRQSARQHCERDLSISFERRARQAANRLLCESGPVCPAWVDRDSLPYALPCFELFLFERKSTRLLRYAVRVRQLGEGEDLHNTHSKCQSTPSLHCAFRRMLAASDGPAAAIARIPAPCPSESCPCSSTEVVRRATMTMQRGTAGHQDHPRPRWRTMSLLGQGTFREDVLIHSEL